MQWERKTNWRTEWQKTMATETTRRESTRKTALTVHKNPPDKDMGGSQRQASRGREKKSQRIKNVGEGGEATVLQRRQSAPKKVTTGWKGFKKPGPGRPATSAQYGRGTQKEKGVQAKEKECARKVPLDLGPAASRRKRAERNKKKGPNQRGGKRVRKDPASRENTNHEGRPEQKKKKRRGVTSKKTPEPQRHKKQRS